MIFKAACMCFVTAQKQQTKRGNKRVFNHSQTNVLFFTNGGILGGYSSKLDLHLSGTPSQKTGTSPPSCLLLDNRLYMRAPSYCSFELGFTTQLFQSCNLLFSPTLPCQDSNWGPSWILVCSRWHSNVPLCFGK